MPSSPLYCDACGAANPTQATRCWACGQLVAASTENTISASSPPAEQPAPPPALLVGRYRLIGMIGTGGFGAVYKAQDRQRNNWPVAIKSINLHHLSPEQIIEATDTFNREVRLLTGLEHPNLPRIHDHFTDPEHWYLVMDFIEGETLAEYLHHSRQGYLPVEEVLTIGVQLCSVLHYLHSQQPPIIFRDVKPGNIMRTPMGRLYLIDFGIARSFTPGQARDTMPLGSPGYAAPEQYGKTQTTAQSDIYSLGATLQTLLTGKEPLELSSGYGPPYPQGQVIPVALDLLLAHMLDAHASMRPASMETVKQALQQIQDERSFVRSRQPVRPPQQTAPPAWTAGGQILQPPATRPARRGISRRVVIVGLAGLAIGGITWMISQGSQGTQINQSLQTFPQNPPQSSPGLLYTYRGHSDTVQAVAWSPDGRRIASGSDDVQVWDATTGGNVLTYTGHHSHGVNAVAWSPDGKHIASAGGDTAVQVWEASSGATLLTYMSHAISVLSVAWSPDGKRIALANGDGLVQVWDAITGGNVRTYTDHSGSSAVAVAWSPDGKRIASGIWDNTVQVWDATTGGNVLTYTGHSDRVNAVAWSPDGKRIASAGADTTVQVWDASTGRNVLTYTGHSAGVDPVAHGVLSVAWSPDGKRIASAGGDTTVQVWDAMTGGKRVTYTGHTNAVYSVAWSPDGKYIASGSWDKTVQVWQAE
jgi:WD40 repeat protein